VKQCIVKTFKNNSAIKHVTYSLDIAVSVLDAGVGVVVTYCSEFGNAKMFPNVRRAMPTPR